MSGIQIGPFRDREPFRGRGQRLVSVVIPALAILLGALPGTVVLAQDADGFAALRAGDYDEAVRALRGSALDGDAAALSGWVTALRETGDYGGAAEAAERGVERGVRGARALLGAALMDVGRLDAGSYTNMKVPTILR
ncbi:MAG: hypothetical protein F4Y07_11605, partial [Gemmatimonadetes bacterium]|nr:hypothetical protein [Gemmatimonadota bacterium]